MSERPNILLVMVDQLMPQLTGAYGHPVVKTPNLDALGREGVRFDAAYSPCPICAPARACLMTGQYTSTNGAYDNGALHAADALTFAHLLEIAGYDTALSGKMHFVGPDQLHGFRMRMLRNIYPADFRWTPYRELPATTQAKGRLESFPNESAFRHAANYVGSAVRVGEHVDTLSYDEETHFRALEYLRAQGQRQRVMRKQQRDIEPFCLCVSYHHPHEPFCPPQKYWDLYEGAEIGVPEQRDDVEATRSIMDRWLNTFHSTDDIDVTDPESVRRVRRAFYALTTYVDDKLGELLSTLKQFGMDENTVILFTSDHGDMLCEKGMVQKRSFYEWSARVPLVMRFPDGRGAGRVVKAPVNLVDLAPTLCEIAGVEAREHEGIFEGESLVPLAREAADPDRVTFSEMHSEGTYAPCFMVRWRQYKLIVIHGHERQLFDVDADPGEWNNLVDDPEMASVVERLQREIDGRFNAEAIDRDVKLSIKRRVAITRAMFKTKTSWSVSPQFPVQRNALTQYLP